jgi:hypothetical protein
MLIAEAATQHESADVDCEVSICPIQHPLAILRGQTELEPIILEYLTHVKDYHIGTSVEIIDCYDPPEGALLYPSLREIETYLSTNMELGASVDIEAAGPHIICVGLCRLSDLIPIVIRFRCKGGGLWDSSFKTIYKKVELLDKFFSNSNIPKIFHFGVSYDIPELTLVGFADGTAFGFNVRGAFTAPVPDTLLAQATALPGLPKDLATCAKMHLGFANWKHLVNEDDEMGEEK